MPGAECAAWVTEFGKGAVRPAENSMCLGYKCKSTCKPELQGRSALNNQMGIKGSQGPDTESGILLHTRVLAN
jgi:hypothetical protein